MNARYIKRKTALILWFSVSGAALLILGVAASPLYALRANMMKDLKRLEDMGHYEQVLFYRKSTMDMVMALHVQWAGAPYDRRMDGVYAQLDNIYGTGKKTRHRQVETRVDRRYWNLVNAQKRPISELLAKASLTPIQLEKLNERVRVYIEDHMSPEFDDMGNFFFRRKAMIFERTGLFWDASFRRRLTGYYDVRVCAPYYATIAEELESSGQKLLADAYRRKSEWYRVQAVREFCCSNGDRLLSEIQEENRRQRLTKEQTIEVLKMGLQSKESDARFTAMLNLAELRETGELLPAAEDEELEIRREVAKIFADRVYVPGLAVLLSDQDEQIRNLAKSVLQPASSERGPFIRAVCALREALDSELSLRDVRGFNPRTSGLTPRTNASLQDDTKTFAASQLALLRAELGKDDPAELKTWAEQATGGLMPGVYVQYFKEPGQPPVVEKVIRTINLGFRGNERFLKLLRPHWDKEHIFPANAKGQFLLKFKGKIYLPKDGRYRFYVKTEGNNRATVRLTGTSEEPHTIISPKNDREFMYADQCDWNGGVISRVDISAQLELKKGLMDLEIDYKGNQVRTKHGKAGIRLYWSSDEHVMELVPASVLFHKTR